MLTACFEVTSFKSICTNLCEVLTHVDVSYQAFCLLDYKHEVVSSNHQDYTCHDYCQLGVGRKMIFVNVNSDQGNFIGQG